MNSLWFDLHSKENKETPDDPMIESEINGLIDAILDEEKKEFRPGLESFQVHANRIRHEVSEAMHEFQKNYTAGYAVLCERLEKEGIEKPNLTSMPILEDPLAFIEALEKGKAIYQVLGFSADQMKQFYKAAHSIAIETDFAKARDSFYFLTTIAPKVSPFWLGLGLCNSQLKNYEASRDAFLQAITLDPTNPDAYLGCIHALVKIGQIDEAHELCERGLIEARGQLAETLEAAKQYLNSHYQKHS